MMMCMKGKRKNKISNRAERYVGTTINENPAYEFFAGVPSMEEFDYIDSNVEISILSGDVGADVDAE